MFHAIHILVHRQRKELCPGCLHGCLMALMDLIYPVYHGRGRGRGRGKGGGGRGLSHCLRYISRSHSQSPSHFSIPILPHNHSRHGPLFFISYIPLSFLSNSELIITSPPPPLREAYHLSDSRDEG